MTVRNSVKDETSYNNLLKDEASLKVCSRTTETRHHNKHISDRRGPQYGIAIKQMKIHTLIT